MKPSVAPLRAAIALSFVWIVVLSPIFLETRPMPAALRPLGIVALVFIFSGFGMNIAAFSLLRNNPRRAALLAAPGPFLFVGPLIGDQLSLLWTLPTPRGLDVMELVALGTETLIFVFAVRLLRQLRAGAEAGPRPTGRASSALS